MKVSELIEQLQKLPPDAEVWHLWDGTLRTEINYVWLARNGQVGTADWDQACYDKDERPENAAADPRWRTPGGPSDNSGAE